MGKGTPIAPVDAVRTESRGMPSAPATAVAIRRLLATPSGPVRAFALPLLAMIARASALGRWLAHQSTAAARLFDCVKHPAALAGVSERISARSERFTLMPAAPPAKEKPRGILTKASIDTQCPSSRKRF